MPWLRPGQVVFTYFRFAADAAMFRRVRRRGITAIAYETIQLPDGSLPCLTPMSEIAGRMAVHEGAKYLEEPMHGRGLLLAGVPGAVARTSTGALTNATFPYVLAIANHGYQRTAQADPALAAGINLEAGRVLHPGPRRPRPVAAAPALNKERPSCYC